MALPIVESTPAAPGSNTSVADHKVPRFGALAAEAKARFGDNPTVAPAGAATGTVPPPTVPASPPAVIPDAASQVQPRTSPSSREYLTPSQAADQGQPTLAASGQPQAQPVVQGADPGKTPEQQILDIPDDSYVRLPVDGKLELMTGKEAKARMMRAADYTRKTQELAVHRRAIQPFVEAAQGDPRRAQELLQSANEAPQLRTILSDPDMLERYLRATNHPLLSRLQQQPGQQPAQQPTQARPNPDELASLGEVEKIAGDRFATVDQKVAAAMERIQQVEDGVVTAIEKKLQFLDNATEAKRIKGQLSGVIADTIKENPVLKVIPNVQRDVLHEVRAMGPRNEAEVLQATQIVLQAFIDNAQQTYENLYAKQALERKHVLTQGIEPPTGTSVSIQPPTSFVDPRTGKFSFDNMRRAARGYNRT